MEQFLGDLVLIMHPVHRKQIPVSVAHKSKNCCPAHDPRLDHVESSVATHEKSHADLFSFNPRAVNPAAEARYGMYTLTKLTFHQH